MSGSWLDAIPLPARMSLVLGSIAVLGAGTIGLGVSTMAPATGDLVAVGIVCAVIAGWFAAWRQFGAPRARALEAAAHRAYGERRARQDHAIAGWTAPETGPLDVLGADPRFSLPLWTMAVRELAGPGPAACPRLMSAERDGDRIRTRVAVREPGQLRVLTVLLANGSSTLLDASLLPDDADPPPAVDPGWPAARRALVARDGAFDVAGFEAQAREISVALDAGDDAARPYLTPDGARDLAYWRIVGVPPGGEDVEWLEIEQDGAFDRVELRVGGRVLSLRRAAGRTEASWDLWRLRSAA